MDFNAVHMNIIKHANYSPLYLKVKFYWFIIFVVWFFNHVNFL